MTTNCIICDTTPSSSLLPSYFILSNSHAKYLDETLLMTHYQQQIHAISGLKCRDNHDPDLSVHSLLQSQILSSSLNAANVIMILVGTNSVRYVDIVHLIPQISCIVDCLHCTYLRLIYKYNISIMLAFPCPKPTSIFLTTSSLSSNISLYNTELKELSLALNFTVVDFVELLSADGMHF